MIKHEVEYHGRMVNKAHFRAYVYSATREKRLVNSWDEYKNLICTGLWHSKEDEVHSKDVTKEHKETSSNPGILNASEIAHIEKSINKEKEKENEDIDSLKNKPRKNKV